MLTGIVLRERLGTLGYNDFGRLYRHFADIATLFVGAAEYFARL